MKTKSARGFLVLFGSIFLLVGLLLAVIAFSLRQRLVPREDRVYTEAVISRIERSRDSDGERRSTVYVSYAAGEQELETQLNYYSASFREGQRITIYYDRKYPTRISCDARDRLPTIILLLVGLPFAAVGGIAVFKGIQRARPASRLKQTGIKGSAAYSRTQCQYAFTLNGSNPYVIQAKAFDPETMQVRVFLSEWFEDDPAPIIKRENIKTFPLYLDPKNPRKYYLDVSAVKKLMDE